MRPRGQLFQLFFSCRDLGERDTSHSNLGDIRASCMHCKYLLHPAKWIPNDISSKHCLHPQLSDAVESSPSRWMNCSRISSIRFKARNAFLQFPRDFPRFPRFPRATKGLRDSALGSTEIRTEKISQIPVAGRWSSGGEFIRHHFKKTCFQKERRWPFFGICQLQTWIDLVCCPQFIREFKPACILCITFI